MAGPPGAEAQQTFAPFTEVQENFCMKVPGKTNALMR